MKKNKHFMGVYMYLICMLLACTHKGTGLTDDVPFVKPGQNGGWGGDPIFSETVVFPKGINNRPNYRIPTIVKAFNNDLLVFAEKRQCGIGDQGWKDIVMKRSADRGATWGEEIMIYSSGNESNSYPCTIMDEETQTIWLFFLRDMKEFYLMKSTNNGHTWSQPFSIHKQVTKPEWDAFDGSVNRVNNPPFTSCAVSNRLKTEDWESDWKQRYGLGAGNAGVKLTKGPRAGWLIMPARHLERVNGARVQAAHVIYSDDGGESWHVGTNALSANGNEAQLVELANGDLMINGRDPGSGGSYVRWVNISRDGGDTWGVPYQDEALIEPSCHASIQRYTTVATGGVNRLLFSNPKNAVRTPEHPYGRTNITVRLSYDEGKNWTAGKLVYPRNASYSDIVVLDDMSIGVLYERGQPEEQASYWDELCFARFNLEWLTDGEDFLK